MSFVLDCSVAASWYLPGEQTPATLAIRERLLAEWAQVPSLWPVEMANVLLVSERRGRIDQSQTKRIIAGLSALPIAIADPPSVVSLEPLLDLARHHGLSVYDAAYLELALANTLPLATLDARLRAAAIAEGVSVL